MKLCTSENCSSAARRRKSTALSAPTNAVPSSVTATQRVSTSDRVCFQSAGSAPLSKTPSTVAAIAPLPVAQTPSTRTPGNALAATSHAPFFLSSAIMPSFVPIVSIPPTSRCRVLGL
ncbi:MAG: hypothetical protein F4X54_01485 [Chloroflexi bacterium]|nr:hypothetical protein [Chloroflexota bacterium]